MVLSHSSVAEQPVPLTVSQGVSSSPHVIESGHGHSSGVSWGAILAGAAGAAALSLILVILGMGLGLSSVSPWAYDGISAKTFGQTAILWTILTQLLAACLGGYLAGRLRTRWVSVHTDEVYFRDTAHGFLAWAVASLVTAALLTTTISSIISGGVHAGASMAGSVAESAVAMAAPSMRSTANGPLNYGIDSLFRKDPNTSVSIPMTSESGTNVTTEVSRIVMNSIATGTLPQEDIQYIGQLVAQRTGLSQADAEKRVTDMYTRTQAALRNAEAAAKDSADQARKASAHAALWLFISLLIGAFIASLSATYGGRRRDL